MNCLRCRLPPAHQLVLEEYVQAASTAGVERVASRLHERYIGNMGAPPYVEALVAFHGFQTVAAMTAVSSWATSASTNPPAPAHGLPRAGAGEDPAARAAARIVTKTGSAMRPLDAHRVRLPLQPPAARLPAALRPPGGAEPRGARHRLARPAPAKPQKFHAAGNPPPAPQQAVVAVAH
ncbi:MAG: hypothetical protein R3F11_01425 [Verrucomicrobiales bacterium]